MNFHQIASKIIERLRNNPKSLYFIGKAFIRGCLYVAYYRLFRKNVRIKLPFFVYDKVKISGPGTVFIDKGCSVYINIFDGLTIATFSANAQVNIGKKCGLGGVTIRCHKKIEIGSYVIFANCLVQDTLFSMAKPISLKTDNTDLLSPLEVSIGKGSWLSGQTIVLRGSKIGDESVMSIGGVCFSCNIPKGHLFIGNPVFRNVSIEKMVSLGNP